MAAAKPNQSPSLPPYTEMIFAAIDSQKRKEGSSESAISEYIESTCDNLPEEHSNILTDNLNKLVESGELVMLNENYSRPEPVEAPKRGRGRPPKAKDPSVAEVQAAPAEPGSEVKRGRGRPKKDPNAPPSAKKVKVASAVPPPSSKTGRPRGRPRKVQPELTSVEAN